MLAGGQRPAGVSFSVAARQPGSARTRPHRSPDTHTDPWMWIPPRSLCTGCGGPEAREGAGRAPSGQQTASSSAIRWAAPLLLSLLALSGPAGFEWCPHIGEDSGAKAQLIQSSPHTSIVLIWAPGAPHVPMKFPSDHLEGRGPVLKHLHFF